MPGTWDANIKLLYAVDDGQFFAVDTIKAGDPLDVIANIEIGESLMEVVDKFDLFVSVRNLSQSSILLNQTLSDTLTPVSAPFNAELRVNFAGGWTANEGDILEVVAAFKVTGGVHQDYSLARSAPFMVST
jgi:hypothetical protein